MIYKNSLNKNLEELVNEMNEKTKKVMVISDLHIPHMDINAYNVMKQYAKFYKPNEFIINGDLLDFYTLSKFDKNPERKVSSFEEIRMARKILQDLRKTMPNTKMVMLEGNHENRLQRFLWGKAPELEMFPELELKSLLQLKEQKIKFISVDSDYWKNDTGHYTVGNVLIMHGDNRLNGGSLSKYSGYSVKNTMLNGLRQNVIIGHCHRLAKIYHTTNYGTLTGMEGGCLCDLTGTANWQQGFVTFELLKGEMINPLVYRIENGTLYTNNKTFKNGTRKKRK